MTNYFYDDKKIIRKELLDGDAKNWAESFVKNKLSSTQLRKFHIEAKTLEERINNFRNPESDFKEIKPLVKMMKSKVAYAYGRDKKVPKEFKKYIEDMVDNIEKLEDFKAFALCFEAVVGFYYGEGGGKIR